MKSDKPSETAAIVASSLVSLRKNPSLSWFFEDWSDALDLTEECLREHSQLKFWLSKSQVPERIKFDKFSIPSITYQYICRKWFFKRNIIEAIKERDMTRVVILGAGYDCTPIVIARAYPKVQILELDHHATQSVKVKALEGTTPSNHHFIPIDLASQRLKDVLPAFRGKTVVLSEGLNMYLNEESNKNIFEDIFSRCADGSELLLTLIEPKEIESIRDKFRNAIVKLYLKLTGEPFLWSLSSEHFTSFAESLGFQVTSTLTMHDVRTDFSEETGIQVPPFKECETIATCKVDAQAISEQKRKVASNGH